MLNISFKVDAPRGARLEMPVETIDQALYTLTYRYEPRGAEWWAVLEGVSEIMPPITPQASGISDDARLPMMENGAFSVRLEAAQRRKEWQQVAELANA